MPYSSLNSIKKLAKTDLHNHGTLGGNFEKVIEKSGIHLPKPNKKLKGIEEMNDYIVTHLRPVLSVDFMILAFKACFEQAKQDGVIYLEASIDAGLFRSSNLTASEFVAALQQAHQDTAPEINYLPQLGFARESPLAYSLASLEELSDTGFFKSMDLYGNEFFAPTKNYTALFDLAAKAKLRKSCHVGEIGSAKDIMEAVDLLELDSIQHGIAAAKDLSIMKELAARKIPLHICPNSNVRLSLVESIEKHPIRSLVDNEVCLTINTDDVFFFEEGVSEQYLSLCQKGVLKPEELEVIRLFSLDYAQKISAV